jgi:tetratricopeptide (TPR) repeat protein
LTTAGAYLSQTSGDCSVLEYLTLYDQQWHELEKHADELLEYEDRTLFSTWNLSLEQVEKQNADAAKMLRLLAFFGNSGINFELFRRVRDLQYDYTLDWLNALTESKVMFNRAMAKLHDYSLIERSPDGYSLHTCVHDWTLQALNASVQPEYFWSALLCIAAGVESSYARNSWQNNQRLFPHALRIEHDRFQVLLEGEVSEDRQAAFLEQVGILWYTQGVYEKAEGYVLRALKGRERFRGHDSVAVLNSISTLAYISSSLGKFTQAEELYKRALAGYEKMPDPNNGNLPRLYNNLSHLHIWKGDYVAAEQLLLRALEGKEDREGPNAASTLITADALAEVYAKQKRFSEAEAMLQRALEGLKIVLGAAHPRTLNAVERRGQIHFDQKQWEEAERVWKQVLEDRKTVLGSNHRDTLHMALRLGHVYQKQLKLNELVELAKIWGSRAPKIFDILSEMGPDLLEKGNVDHAVIVFQHEMRRREAVLGPDHVDTQEAAGSLGGFYRTVGKLDELVKLAETWGPRQAALYKNLARMGKRYAREGDIEKATRAFQSSLHVRDSAIFYHSMVWCDGCQSECRVGVMITLAMGHFICKQCEDIDLCRQCYEKHQDGTNILASCKDHAFFEVPLEPLTWSSGSAAVTPQSK